SLSGSILFWGGVLGIYVGGWTLAMGDRHREYLPWALHVLLGISVFFALLVASIANPFAPVFPVPLDGPGPNPLLQNHWLMSIHPPTLYLGYVGMAVPYAMICAALLAGRLEAGWMDPLRRWAILPWTFLSAGIVLGGWWSYEVLGWGGAWAWDPVENASFHPWLTGTAFLHSAMVVQRRGWMRDWTLTLGMSTFLLTLVGTFMTRSGVFNSVHSFTQSDIGPVFLAFIAVVLTYSVALLALRSHTLDDESERMDAALGGRAVASKNAMQRIFSRETAILVQNALFTVFTFTVLLGTLYPLITEAVEDRRVSVGEPYFDRWALPLGLLIVFMMGVGPALPWGGLKHGDAPRRFAPGAVAGLVLALIFGGLGFTKPWTLVAMWVAGFALWTSLVELAEPVRIRMRAHGEAFGRALGGLLKARRRTGAHIAHLGIILALVSLALSKGYRVEQDLAMQRGETAVVHGFPVRFTGAAEVKEDHRTSRRATFALGKDGGLGTYEPRMNFYPANREPVFTPAVHVRPEGDLYFSLIEMTPDGNEVVVRIIWQPGQMWLWLVGPMIAIGSWIAIWPTRRKAEARVPAGAAVAK
ncbi:MAG: heme lyase CcmF/NrfE family subunit, partial [Deltaproteobacteria bacterium]|nr:heme lyase CcmF/NrfE family subunit [Deltaproteobacteria bacterium]